RRDGVGPPGDHRDVLRAVDRVGDRTGVDAGPRVELPQYAARLLVERLEPALRVAVEHEPTIGRQHPTDVGERLFVAPERLLLDGVQGDRLAHEPARPGPAAPELRAH